MFWSIATETKKVWSSEIFRIRLLSLFQLSVSEIDASCCHGFMGPLTGLYLQAILGNQFSRVQSVAGNISSVVGRLSTVPKIERAFPNKFMSINIVPAISKSN